MKRFLLPFLSLALLPSLGARQSSTGEDLVPRIIKEGRENTRVMDHLDHLVHKIGPRLTSSDNLTRACEWARDRFKSWGLDARLEKWADWPVGFNRGPWSGVMNAPERRRLTFCTPSWTPGTQGPLEGPAILAPTKVGEIDLAKLKGAWVIQRLRPRGELRDKVRAAYDKAGIAGVVRRVGRDLIVTSGRIPRSWDAIPRQITIDMIPADFDAIEGHLKSGKRVSLTFAIKNEFKKGPVPLYNVVADWKGTEKPDEYVIVGGHIDSWDGARGTVDNGTGCATTLEAARILASLGVRPKRTVRFMLWGGEEQGLLGSRAYVRAHPDLMKKISCVLVHDGGTNYVSGIAGTAAMIPVFERVFKPVLALDKAFPFTIRKTPAIFPFGASDHASFIQAGVPGFFWDQAGRANYNFAHHTQHDLIDQAIPEYQRHSATVIALAAWGFANEEALLPRDGVRTRGGFGARRGGSRRTLGVYLDGTVVTGIVEESPAEKAGLTEGDEIVKLGGRAVDSHDTLVEAIQKAKKKDTIVVRRAGKELTLPVAFP